MEPSRKLEMVAPADNKFTKMIFDSKVVKKQRDKAAKSSRSIQVKSQPVKAQEQKVTEPRKSAKPVEVASAIKNIRKTGLSNLIGKISKRVSRNSGLIVSSGVSADNEPTGRAMASLGSVKSSISGKGEISKVTIKGVSTTGVGGGSKGALRGISGLSVGKVGSGEVGIVEEETDVEGGLEKEVISSYIKTQLGQIRYCYERQLSASPDLYGKIHIKFTIGGNGQVIQQAVGLTTLQNAMVEGCILRRVATWKFPEPKGGTLVVVTYPFLFKSNK
jgi:outer membrane biosynthesis protein TonB